MCDQVVVVSWGCIPDAVVPVPDGADGTAFLREVAARETDAIPEDGGGDGYIAFGDWEWRLMDVVL